MGPFAAANAAVAPFWQFAMPEFQYALGLNTASRDRFNLYRNNRESTLYPRNADHSPVRMAFAQLLQSFNMQPWATFEDDEEAANTWWDNLRIWLRYQGIDMMSRTAYLAANDITLAGELESREWHRLIEMSSAAAPLGTVIRDYYRSQALEGDRKVVSTDELNWNFERGQYRREQDRTRILAPFADWTPDQITHLRRIGAITPEVELSLLQASGIVRSEDREIRKALEQRFADPSTLMGWASRSLWTQSVLDALKLDEGFEGSTIARFFSKISGIGTPHEPLPGQPAGETDWAKLTYRASRHLPTFEECRRMQWRLRRTTANPARSIVGDIPTWTEGHTAQVLYASGMPEPVAQQLMGLVTEPMPLHMLATVLTPILEHPVIRRMAQELFPNNEDWLKASLYDHGFDRRHISLMTAAIRQEASDKANAELIAHKKQIRQENRTVRFEAYKLGIEDDETTRRKVVSEQFTEEMANDTMAIIEVEISNRIYQAKMEAIKEAFMSGQKTVDQTKAAFDLVGIAEARRDQYIDEWTWSRTTNQRHLVTGEIMNAMKNGIMSSQQAMARLRNLGWTQADAMVEVQVVQHELDVAQQRLAAHNQAVAQAAAAKARHEQQIAAEKAKAAADRAQAIKDRLSKEKLLATHAKLRDQSEYFAKVHAANSDYHKADKVGDEERKAAELAKEIAAYHEWLYQQQALINEGREIANVVGPIQTQAAQGPPSSEGTPSAPSTPPTSSGGPGKPGGGSGNPPTP